MRKVRDNSAVPKGGQWYWRHAETGHLIKHPYYNQIKSDVKKFLLANNYPIGANFDEDFEQNICANADPAVCMDWTPPSILEKMSSVAQALVKVAYTSRDPLVSAEVLEQRRQICSECNFFGGSRSLVKVACRRCGCAGLKLALRSSTCPIKEAPKWGPV